MFCDEFNPGVTILEDWISVVDEKVDYNKIFYKYDITHVLVKNSEILSEKIQRDDLWKQIYKDDNFTLYEHKK